MRFQHVWLPRIGVSKVSTPLPALKFLTAIPIEDRRCVNCGDQIRPVVQGEGIDQMEYQWTHTNGGVMCDNGYFSQDIEAWVDPTQAIIGGEGLGQQSPKDACL